MTPTLYVSSEVKDTDFTVKVIDVYPDGRAFTLDESIQRMRYRNGYDKPLVWMEPGKVYKVVFLPLTTSNYFDVGHRLRVEISSSSFPEYERNLNTGGRNYDESKYRSPQCLASLRAISLLTYRHGDAAASQGKVITKAFLVALFLSHYKMK